MDNITDNFINIATRNNSVIPTIIDKINCSATSVVTVDNTIEIVSKITNRPYYVYIESPNCTKYL